MDTMDREMDYAVKFCGDGRVGVEIEMFADESYMVFFSIGKRDDRLLFSADCLAAFIAALHEIEATIPGLLARLRKATAPAPEPDEAEDGYTDQQTDTLRALAAGSLITVDHPDYRALATDALIERVTPTTKAPWLNGYFAITDAGRRVLEAADG